MAVFTDENTERLFGAEDAENELESRFREYFYYNKTYENLVSSLPIRILVGHKGVGKSALLKRAHLEDKDKKIMSVWLRPSEVTLVFGKDVRDFNKLIEHWKQGILAIIAKNVLGDAANDLLEAKKMQGFAAKVGSFLTVLSGKIVDLAGKAADGLSQAVVEQFGKSGVINVYIDDIDRGWSASQGDIRNISALINAIRDLSGSDQRIRFRLGLRSDVYFLVRTSDESTDKIERNVIWLSWSNHEILCIIAKRIETFFGSDRHQADIFKMQQQAISKQILARVMESVYTGAGHWSARPIHNVLLSLTRQRPRDLVKLMHGAAKRAYAQDHSTIASSDLNGCFEEYSNERLQDIVNEFKSELPDIERLLLGMRASKKERKTAESFLFSGDTLSAKIGTIMDHVAFKFTSGRPVSGKALIQFLYKIDFITARKRLKDGRIDRKYFDANRFLANEFVDFGYDWEIHPAYRWALNPQDIQAVIDSIDD